MSSHPLNIPWNAPFRIGKVKLTVKDIEKVSAFYQQVIGLHLLGSEPGLHHLGVGKNVLLDLRHDPSAQPASRREAGLFHMAFLLPSRADLARWLNFVVKNRLPVHGASDHKVSEAVYLADPEGNGIEVYADRSPDDWVHTTDGYIKMTTDALNVEDLLAADDGVWQGVPEGTFIGHLHLQVGDLAESEHFYKDFLGFDLTTRYPGANFFSSGGYHHHLGVNVWNSGGAGERSKGRTGLAGFEIAATSEESFKVLAAKSGAQLRDPWGTEISIVRS